MNAEFVHGYAWCSGWQTVKSNDIFVPYLFQKDVHTSLLLMRKFHFAKINLYILRNTDSTRGLFLVTYTLLQNSANLFQVKTLTFGKSFRS